MNALENVTGSIIISFGENKTKNRWIIIGQLGGSYQNSNNSTSCFALSVYVCFRMCRIDVRHMCARIWIVQSLIWIFFLVVAGRFMICNWSWQEARSLFGVKAAVVICVHCDIFFLKLSMCVYYGWNQLVVLRGDFFFSHSNQVRIGSI